MENLQATCGLVEFIAVKTLQNGSVQVPIPNSTTGIAKEWSLFSLGGERRIMKELTKTSTSAEIKQYFNAILKLSKASEEFPVNLDEVWPLVYGSKKDATDVLKKDFLQLPENESFGENPERTDYDYTIVKERIPAGHTVSIKENYYLSVPCLEFFIARKVRDVFEVYRQVFHKTAKVIENKEKTTSARTMQLMRLDTAKWLMKNLNYNEASKLELARALAEPLELPTPSYVKAKDSSVAPTHLLVARGYGEGFTQKFNCLMFEAGLLEQKQRPSSTGSGKIKKYWKLTEAGLIYGENQKAPENPRSIQPLYYEAKFDELLEKLGVPTKKEEA